MSPNEGHGAARQEQEMALTLLLWTLSINTNGLVPPVHFFLTDAILLF